MRIFWIQVLLLLAASALGNTTNDLIACFRMAGNGVDSRGNSPDMTLGRAPFVGSTLYLNGCYEFGSSRNGYHATASVPSLDYQSVSFAVDFYPLRAGRRTGLNRFELWLDFISRGYYTKWFIGEFRDDSNIITGGPSYRWLGLGLESNQLQLTLNNHSFTHTFTSAKVKRGRWHNLICSLDLRRKEILTTLDGQSLETINLPQDFKLEVIESADNFADRAFTFVDYSNGSVFYGFAANLQVFGRSLTTSEMIDLYQVTTSERPHFSPEKFSFSSLAIVLFGIGGLLVAICGIWRGSRMWQRTRVPQARGAQ